MKRFALWCIACVIVYIINYCSNNNSDNNEIVRRNEILSTS